MSLSPVKRLILETMWVIDKPAKPVEVAKETGVNFPTCMMHIIGLTKLEYLASPEKGWYRITDKGKRMLGFPELTRERASEILAYRPVDMAFHFYADIGKPLNVYAVSLGDFCDKIEKVDAGALEFHVNRGDFEAWFAALGDAELARKITLIKDRKVMGEDLRGRLLEMVKKRSEELAKVRSA